MYGPADFDLCAAVGDDAIFEACLCRSPDIATGALGVRQFPSYASAASALSAALDSISAPVVIIPHQDVYLPRGFADNLARQLTALEAIDHDWAVVSCIGIDAEGTVRGETWSSGMGKRVGVPVHGAGQVVTVDELILVVRTASGVRLDRDLPGFHLYGTDLVVAAKERSLSTYVVPLPVVRHSRALVRLGKDYWRAYLHLRRRWSHRLPVPTMFGGIRHSLMPLARVDLEKIARKLGYEKS